MGPKHSQEIAVRLCFRLSRLTVAGRASVEIEPETRRFVGAFALVKP